MFSQEVYNDHLARKNAIQLGFFSRLSNSTDWQRDYANDFDDWFQTVLESREIDSISNEGAREKFIQYEREHGKNIH